MSPFEPHPSGTTPRVVIFQNRAQIEASVQVFALRTRYVPLDAQRVRAVQALPSALARITEELGSERQAWLAWALEERLWFVTARKLEHLPARRIGEEALQMDFYDVDGRVVSSGTWDFRVDGTWKLRAP